MKKLLFALLCTTCFCIPAFSQVAKQSLSLDDVVSRLQTLSTTKAIEKVYLHFDRTLYNAGDTVFFKAYLTLGEQHQLSKLSGVLHVDLMNTSDSLVQSISLQAANGIAWGDFALPNKLPKGIYHIKAYTKWMLNNADPGIFDQPIVINSAVPATQVLAARPATISNNKFDIQFFAEGGTFVNDIPAKLAFKAIGQNGLGADVKGVVVDNLNTEVTKFEAKHLGMGIIYITPVEGRSYKAKLTYADGTKAVVDLPKADSKGMALLVNNDKPDKLMIEINVNRPYYLENKNKEIGVVIYSNGSVRSLKTTLDNQVLDINLDKKDFQTGIVQVTLFSQTGEPLNERLSFIQNNDHINLQTGSDKPAYTTRGKVHVTVSAKKDDKPVTGYFSASVIDATKIPVNESAETTILTHLLLTSALQGFVEQPNYYFARVTADTRADLDILMLTQGYRRFTWKQLLGDAPQATATYPVEKGLDISGTVKTTAGVPVANGSVTLLTQNGGTMLNQVTDANGRFNFANLIYTTNTAFVIQAKTEAGKSNTQIIMDQPRRINISTGNSPTQDKGDAGKTGSTAAAAVTYMADANGKLLKEVIVKDKYLDSEHTTVNQFSDQTGISRGLEGHLPGVALMGGVPYLRERVGLTGAGPMLVIIDGVQSSSNVDNLSVSDVVSVKMLKNVDAAIFGSQGANGVLLITTAKNKTMAVNKKISPGLLSYAPRGFYKARVFYSPAYGPSAAQSNKADERSTIYWNPDIVTDKEGNASFDFYNADGKGNYRVVVEGMDEDGNIGRSVYAYKVE